MNYNNENIVRCYYPLESELAGAKCPLPSILIRRRGWAVPPLSSPLLPGSAADGVMALHIR